jgi:Protein of unknown function (DUF2585)
VFPWLNGVVPPLIVLGVALLLAPARNRVLAVLLIVALTGALELAMGRPLVYRHGPLRLWSGDIMSDQNSQQIADPYTFTHVVYGAALYGATWLTLGAQPLAARLLASVALEGAWEAYENTDTVVTRYRTETIALGYYGDSVVNSMADILACVIGFVLARRLPVKATVVGVIATEVILAVWIRDNLTLNVLMLLHPLKAVRLWQRGLR